MFRKVIPQAVAVLCLLALITPFPAFSAEVTSPPDVSMTIKDIAHGHGIKGGDLAEQLGLERSVDKDTPLAQLGVSQQQLDPIVAGLEPVAQGEESSEEKVQVGLGMTVREAAHALGVKGTELAHDLALPVDADKDKTLKELGVSETALNRAVHHIEEEGKVNLKWLKYPIYTLICLLGLVLLYRGKASKKIYLITLAFAALVPGFALGKAPNPMESVVKIFKSAAGVYPETVPYLLTFLFFAVLTVVGNKLICGWGCPFGALEELLFELPLGKKVKKFRGKKLPFVATNSVRALVFLGFVLVIFGVVGSKKGLVLYHYINPFNLFSFEFALGSVIVSVAFFLLLAIFVYRPFCQFLCPFGLLSWPLEKLSLFGVRINRDACTDCGTCTAACPLQAMDGRMEGKTMPADCFSCARCLRSCQYEALSYGLPKKSSV
jgi:ferredoxin